MRRCKASVWADGKEVPVEGLFHQWAAQCIESEDGIGNYTVALIELEDGRIVEANPDKMVFSEPACQQPVWWMRTPSAPMVRSCETCSKPCKKTYPFSSNACNDWASRTCMPANLGTEGQ